MASGLQTEVYGCIRFGDRGLRGHLVNRQSLWVHQVCIQRSVGASGLQTGECEGITLADRGKLGASGMQKKVFGGIGSIDRSPVGALGLQKGL